jgi:hypothetical protein
MRAMERVSRSCSNSLGSSSTRLTRRMDFLSRLIRGDDARRNVAALAVKDRRNFKGVLCARFVCIRPDHHPPPGKRPPIGFRRRLRSARRCDANAFQVNPRRRINRFFAFDDDNSRVRTGRKLIEAVERARRGNGLPVPAQAAGRVTP